MTDAGQQGTEWVPRFEMSELPRKHAELIRGLFELAAFVADHTEVPAPGVRAAVYTAIGGWQAKCVVVDHVAAALGKPAVDQPEHGTYQVEADFGPVHLHSTAFTAQSMAEYDAVQSYSGRVQPDEAVGAGESR
jgi:hypothetical protein